MKLGYKAGCAEFEFWKSLGLKVDWVPVEDGTWFSLDVDGYIADPENDSARLPSFKQVSKQILECGFLDYAERARGIWVPRSFLRAAGGELFGQGTRGLDTTSRAYVTGTGPWARLFATLAVEKGYRHVSFVVENVDSAADLIRALSRFCFGVRFEVVRHVDLTLQPNNGSLLVNTLDAETHADLIADLAYLNYLSPDGLVVETTPEKKDDSLLEEAKNSKLHVLDGHFTRAFQEHRIFTSLPLVGFSMEFAGYLEKRRGFFAN